MWSRQSPQSLSYVSLAVVITYSFFVFFSVKLITGQKKHLFTFISKDHLSKQMIAFLLCVSWHFALVNSQHNFSVYTNSFAFDPGSLEWRLTNNAQNVTWSAEFTSFQTNETHFNSKSIKEGCYSFSVSIVALVSFAINDWLRSSFHLFLNNNPLSLKYQTYTYDLFFTYPIAANVYFCTRLFETENSNNITITMESFPTDTILEIRANYSDNETNVLVYQNNFYDPAYVSTPENVVWELDFGGVEQGCYEIAFYDEDFDFTTSSLAHSKYTIKLNGIIINYGGYYGTEEIFSFCTNDSINSYKYCTTPNSCSGDKFSNLDELTIAAASYRGYYDVVFDQALLVDFNCYGGSSCENTTFIDDDNSVIECSGAYACKNSRHNNSGLWITRDATITCTGYNSCDKNYLDIDASSYHPSGTGWGYYIYCMATQSCSNWMKTYERDDAFVDVKLYNDGSFIAMNTKFVFVNHSIDIYISGYYSLYQASINCVSTPVRGYVDYSFVFDHHATCNIYCQDSNPQIFYAQVCGEDYSSVSQCNATMNVYDCNNVSIETVMEDNVTVTMIEKIQEIEDVVTKSNTECDTQSMFVR